MNTQKSTRSQSTVSGRQYSHDVIIVGGRVAGASTAMLLARGSLRVLVLERAPTPGTDTLSTFALMRPGVLQLRRWGVLDRVIAAGTPAVRSTILHYGDETVVVPIKEKAGVSELFAPRRTILDPILVEAAIGAGAEVRFGSIVNTLVWQDQRVVGVRGRDRGGRPFEARAPLVIGADGRHSFVARSVRAPFTWEGRASGGTIYGFWSGLNVDGYEWFYRPGVSAGIIPTNDGQVLVWVGTDTARLVKEMRGDVKEEFDRLLCEGAPEVEDAVVRGQRVGQFHGFAGMPSGLRKPWGPGWALVGDAGSFRDPISAHGISDALRDAEFLARAVPEYLSDSSNDNSALASYEELRDEAARPLARITDAVASYRWTLDELRELLLDLSKAMGREAEMIVGLGGAPALAA